MAIIQGNAHKSSVSGFYPKTIEGSLRFNDDDSAYLSWTPDSAGDRKTWTWSGWVKRAGTGTRQYLFSTGSSGTNYAHFMIDSDDKLYYVQEATTLYRIGSTQKLRDHSAWYHIMFVMDTTNATANDRMRYYVNGERVDVGVFNAQPTQNLDMKFNQAASHSIGKHNYSTAYADCYMAEVHFLNGIAATADDFGELKNGVWVAKKYEGDYDSAAQVTEGNLNGFHLNFQDDAEVEAFNTVLYRGNGGTQSITGMGFQPDLVWIKARNSTNTHALYDAVRTATKCLVSADTTDETTRSGLTSFDSDGFSLGSLGRENALNQTTVAWGWKAGDSNVSNTVGDIPSTVRANDTYGFSIVSYTGDGTTNGTIGHGLSSAPDFIVAKDRDSNSVNNNWHIWHTSLSSTTHNLNFTPGAESNVATATSYGGIGDPSATTIKAVSGTVDSRTMNESGDDYIAYCWTEKTGYSKFGSYEGNNTATGPTVTTTFKPAFVMIKNADGTGNWNIFDNTRATFPDNDLILRANLSAAEVDGSEEGGDAYEVEFTDTGFIPKASGASSRSQVNGTGTYIYAAFADTREAAFWLDQSGNDNDWQPVNLDHNDTVADSPTNNFCTLNPLTLTVGASSNGTLSDGNLQWLGTSGNDNVFGTIAVSSGQWYYELEILANPDKVIAGWSTTDETVNTTENGLVYYNSAGIRLGNRTVVWDSDVTTGLTFAVNDIIGFALDIEGGDLEVYQNGSLVSTITLPTDKGSEWIPAFGDNSSTDASFRVNFGQQPFKYDPPA